MNETVKKQLTSLMVRALICVIIFFILMGMRHFAHPVFEKCSNVWEKSSQLGTILSLFKEMIKELLPW